MSRPQISIITPMWNAAAYLAEAVESVLAQQGAPAWELLLIDDGSTDGSRDIAAAYAARLPDCIHLLRHPDGGNHGTSASRNLAIHQARGSALALLDADDVWLPHMLRTQWECLQQHPEVAMVYANAERWWSFDEPYDPRTGPRGDNLLPPVIPPGAAPGLLRPPQLLEWFYANETLSPCTCTVLIRTSVVRGLGGFPDQFSGLYDDQALYAKIALSEHVWVHLQCVARYRQHPTSLCNRAYFDKKTAADARKRFEAWLEDYRRHACVPSTTRARSSGVTPVTVPPGGGV